MRRDLNILETSKKNESNKLPLNYVNLWYYDIIEVFRTYYKVERLVTFDQSSNKDDKTENKEREWMSTFI